MRLTGSDIVRWAERNRDAQALLPELVRRLILVTVGPEQLERFEMPADEGIAKHGVDGLVHARVGAHPVPQGWSVWEMGCDEGVQSKASKDYDKRVDEPPAGVDPKQTTFVFVTPRRWAGAAAWELERRAEGHWQEVRVLDADALATWLNHAPAVAESARVGLEARDLADAGDYQLGEVLARAPVGADGRWPHEAVRDLVERFGRAEQLAMGIQIGRRNRRGARVVDPEQDRQQAEQLREDAKFMHTRWPRTARILEQLARGSDHDAESWKDHLGRERDDWTPAASTDDRLEAFLDAIVGEGRYVFDFDEIAAAIGDAPDLAHVLASSPKVAAISDDAYVIVEREYRSRGAPPPSWYLDELMRRAGLRYCVGLLSAAELHGAADQRPQVFQVLVDRPYESATIGDQRLRFIARERAQPFIAAPKNTRTGTMLVATPEATVFDLAEFASHCGGRDHVVSVLEELGEELDATRLIETARAYPPGLIDAAAELLEAAEHDALASSLRDAIMRPAVGA